jgi:hypothetical protein
MLRSIRYKWPNHVHNTVHPVHPVILNFRHGTWLDYKQPIPLKIQYKAARLPRERPALVVSHSFVLESFPGLVDCPPHAGL